MEDENGLATKDPRRILKIKSDYYESLYKKNLTAEEIKREEEMEKELNEAFKDAEENLKAYNQLFTLEELLKCIMLVQMNKAHGPDGITYEMIKNGGTELHSIYQKSFNVKLFQIQSKPVKPNPIQPKPNLIIKISKVQ